jgi:hypothetical protein
MLKDYNELDKHSGKLEGLQKELNKLIEDTK